MSYSLTQMFLTIRKPALRTRYHFSLEKQKSLNINIASYLLETFASPNEKTWHDIGGPITQTINHFSLNPDHRRSVEHTLKTMISSLEKGVKYTGKNITKKHGRPYFISPSSEINMIDIPWENVLVFAIRLSLLIAIIKHMVTMKCIGPLLI